MEICAHMITEQTLLLWMMLALVEYYFLGVSVFVLVYDISIRLVRYSFQVWFYTGFQKHANSMENI